MKCLIIDDDQSCIDRLESKLKDQYGNVELDIFQKPPHIDELQTDYDLFFIDVLLGKESGIEYANSIKDYYPRMTLFFHTKIILFLKHKRLVQFVLLEKVILMKIFKCFVQYMKINSEKI